MKRICVFIKVLFCIFFVVNTEARTGLRVIPADIPILCKSGVHYTGEITVVNLSDKPRTFILTQYDLWINEEGSPITLPVGEGKNSASQWLTFEPDSFVLGPNEEGKVLYNIEVPTAVSAGGYYSAIYIRTLVKAGVHIGIVCKFYITVEGDIVEGDILQKKVIVDEPDVYKTDKGVEIVVRYSNTGNIHFQPNIITEIKNEEGETVKRFVSENSFPILPGCKVSHKFLWDTAPTSGNYQAILIFMYGEENPIVKVKSFSIGE